MNVAAHRLLWFALLLLLVFFFLISPVLRLWQAVIKEAKLQMQDVELQFGALMDLCSSPFRDESCLFEINVERNPPTGFHRADFVLVFVSA